MGRTLPVTTILHSPDAVDSRSMLSASAHPSQLPQVPHASSRTTESTLASRPRSFGLADGVPTPAAVLCIAAEADADGGGATGPPPPACLRAGRTPAAASTSTMGAWPAELCIRCAYVQLSLGIIRKGKYIRGFWDVPWPKDELAPELRGVATPLPYGHCDAQCMSDDHRQSAHRAMPHIRSRRAALGRRTRFVCARPGIAHSERAI